MRPSKAPTQPRSLAYVTSQIFFPNTHSRFPAPSHSIPFPPPAVFTFPSLHHQPSKCQQKVKSSSYPNPNSGTTATHPNHTSIPSPDSQPIIDSFEWFRISDIEAFFKEWLPEPPSAVLILHLGCGNSVSFVFVKKEVWYHVLLFDLPIPLCFLGNDKGG